MESLRILLEQQPLMALFLTIAIGYVVGELNIRGLSLGVGAVLFVALAMGWFAPKAAPAPMIGTFGLALFLYGVGIQYGPQFFAGLTSASGLKANLISLIGVLTAGAVSVAIIKVVGLNTGHGLGLFAGSGTSTSTLQAAITTLGNDDPAVGYSVTYPLGVAGPILILHLAYKFLKPCIDLPVGTGMEMQEIVLRRTEHVGRPLSELARSLPSEVHIVALRRNNLNQPASPDHVLAENDVLLAVAPTRASLNMACKVLGEPGMGITEDRHDLDYVRVFVSKPSVAGRVLGDLPLRDTASSVIHVRRGDVDLLPRADLVLEFGDRVGVLAPRANFPAIRKLFGDSIKGAGEFSYVSLGLGLALGVLVGAIAVPVPGVGTVSLGIAGTLLVALVLGRQRRTGRLTWTLPTSANLVLRNLGLTVFLAQVGMASGPKFVATVSETGFQLLGLGVVVVCSYAIPVLVLGLFVLKLPFDEVAGIVSGACGNPAIVAYANKLTPTDRPDVGYAMIFPGMTIVKILFVSIVPAFL